MDLDFTDRKKRKAEYDKQRWLNNKDRLYKQQKDYLSDPINREKRIKVCKAWLVKNKDTYLSYKKEYNALPINKLRRNLFRRNKHKTNKSFVISCNLRSAFYRSIKSQFTSKLDKTLNLLGCSIEQLKQHLESKFYLNKETGEMMTWDNYGFYGWHIDHIIPVSKFDLKELEQQKQCFHWSNLQPLWCMDNWHKYNH